ncbi:MAG: O-antigen ligase family protein [Nitrospira sp.]|nr:O-antigen ligase family protein [Nitrospira sp.]
MSIVVLLNLAAVVALGSLLFVFSRGTAVLLMLLPASQMLGLVDPMSIAVKGIFDIHLYIVLVTLGLVLLSLPRLRELYQATFIVPYLILCLFWIYGVALPVVAENSSLFLSLKASKEFMSVFSYFGVFLFLRTEKDVEWGWRCLLGLGLYYSGLEILSQVFGETLLKQMSFDYRREAHWFWKVYVSFWPVIVITFLHSFFELTQSAGRANIRLVLTLCGILLTFFRSYLLGVLGAIPVCLLLVRQRLVKILSKAAQLGSLIAASVWVVAIVIGGSFDAIERMFDQFISSGINEFQSQKGGAIEGREVFARERRIILNKNPYVGYGFIDKDSKAGLLFQKQIKGDMLGYIDKGDLDVALKFGYPGQFLLYGTFVCFSWCLIQLARQKIRPLLTVRCLSLAATIFVFLVVQPVHAPLTYSFGLLPFGIALGLIEREKMIGARKIA